MHLRVASQLSSFFKESPIRKKQSILLMFYSIYLVELIVVLLHVRRLVIDPRAAWPYRGSEDNKNKFEGYVQTQSRLCFGVLLTQIVTARTDALAEGPKEFKRDCMRG